MTHILVLHQGAIGDFLLTLSVIQAVRSVTAAGRVTAIASASSARVAAGQSAVDAAPDPDDVGLYKLFRDDLELQERLTSLLADADLVLSFLGGPGKQVHERLSKAFGGRLISVDPRPSAVTRTQRRHITSQWTAAIREAGLDIGDPTPPEIHLPRAAGQPIPRIIVHPGSGGLAKCWPTERFVSLVDSLSGVDVTWMLGPADYQASRHLEDRPESTLIEEDLTKAAEQMARADLYIGNDSGITHLAAAIGLPTVAIFGTTDPAIWRPLGDHVAVVAPADPEAPITDVTVEQVRAVVDRQLGATEFNSGFDQRVVNS